MSSNGASVVTPAIAGAAKRRHRGGSPQLHAKSTASTAKAPTLILTRQRAPTSAPMAAAAARGRVPVKVAASASPRRSTLIRP